MSTISSITTLGTGFSVMKKVLEVRDIAPAGDGWTCTLRMSPGPRDARGARGECGRLRAERIRPDLVHADGSGKVTLPLRDCDRVEDRT